MKSQMIRMMGAGLALWALALGTGCEGDELASSVATPAPGMTLVAAATPAASGDAPPATPAPATTVVPAPEPEPATPPLADALPPDAAATNPPPQVMQPAVIPANLELSPALHELVKMVQAGVGEEVLLAYIANSTNIFNLGANEIVYLNDLGVSSPVITMLIEQEASPGGVARKHAATSAKPLSPELVLTQPATNAYPSQRTPAPPPEFVPAETAAVPGAEAAPATMEVPVEEVPTQVTHFYEPLTPYGNWIQVPDYGWCWQPTVAIGNPYWRPYADNGRWYWTDHGWYWYSYYSWGWAPFHYGRWYQPSGLGWVWVPDTYWGPAWVTWRYTPYYCGWAPLPPRCHYVSGFGLIYGRASVGLRFDFGFGVGHYTFVHWNRFCDRYPHHYYVSHRDAPTIFRDSTPINHFGRDDRPFNDGVGRDRAARMSRNEIQQLRVRAEPLTARPGGRSERLMSDGSALTLVRPALPPPAQRSNGRSPAAPTIADRTDRTRTTAPAGGPATRDASTVDAARDRPDRGGTRLTAESASPSRTMPRNAAPAEGRNPAATASEPAPARTGASRPERSFTARSGASPSSAAQPATAEPVRPATASSRTADTAPPLTRGDSTLRYQSRMSEPVMPRTPRAETPQPTPRPPATREVMRSTLAQPPPSITTSQLPAPQPVQRIAPAPESASRPATPSAPSARREMYRSYADPAPAATVPVQVIPAPATTTRPPVTSRPAPAAPPSRINGPVRYNSSVSPRMQSSPSFPSRSSSVWSAPPPTRSASPRLSAPAPRPASPSRAATPAVRAAPVRPSAPAPAPTVRSPSSGGSRAPAAPPSQRSSGGGRGR